MRKQIFGKGVVSFGLFVCMVLMSACTPNFGFLRDRITQSFETSTTPRVTPIPIDLPPKIQGELRDFDATVNALRDLYIKQDSVGKTWQDEAAANRKKIIEGVKDEEFAKILLATLTSVKDEEVKLLPPGAGVGASQPFTQTYIGVGIVPQLPDANRETMLVLYVYPDSPADQAGVKPHDAILKIADEPVTFADRDNLTQKLRGEADTDVVITVQTPGQDPREVTLTRGPVTPDSRIVAKILPDNDVGYISPDPLYLREMKTDVANALRDMLNDREIKGLILDLRIVRGMDFPINDMLGLFANGTVGNVQRRANKSKLEVTGKSIAGSQEVPMVILVSSLTTGQAEAFAGILQALGRAKVVGESTPGKVAVINTLNLPSNSASVQIPTGEYLSIKDASWYQKGITPDVKTAKTWAEITAENDAQLDQAVDVLLGR